MSMMAPLSLLLMSVMAPLLLSGMIGFALFSHVVRPNVWVQQVFQDRFDLRLRPRLTAAAAAELVSIMSALQEVYLQEGERIEAQEGG